MKKKISLFLTLTLLLSCMLAVPVRAEDSQPPEGSNPTPTTELSTPAPSDPPKETDPKPTDPPKETDPKPTDPTQGSTPTAPSDPKPCTHVFGEWTADEAAHGHTCTLCGYAESNAHNWASEIITVDPTCGEPGGKCKVCTVCGGVLVTELIEPTGKHTFDNACDASCNVCGAERTVEHTFGTGWKYSGQGHWHYCTLCGAAGEVKEHYPGPAATEEKDQICLTCGMVMMKKKPHTHKWDTKWSSDANEHWYACTVCQEKDKTASHVYDNDCDSDCNICSYVRTTAHTYGSDWIQTESTHTGTCAVCGDKITAEPHVADSSGATCRICGYAMAEPEETHEHDFRKSSWQYDETGHWKLCACGEKDVSEPHTWDDGVKKGKQILHTCEVCGAKKTEDAPKNSFPWLLVAAGGGMLVCLAGIVGCILVIRRNREE